MLVGCKQYAGDVANENGFSLWVKPNRLKEFGTFKDNFLTQKHTNMKKSDWLLLVACIVLVLFVCAIKAM